MLERCRHIQLLAGENLRALREREESFQEAERIARIGNWEWDMTADRFSHSAQAAVNIGSPQPPCSFAEFLERVHPDDRDHVTARMRACIEHGQRYEAVFRTLAPGGQERYLLTAGELLRDTAGRPARIRGVCQDVTERERLERQFLQAQKLDSLGRLAGGVAHDFNNLLTVINGRTELALHRLRDGGPLRASLEQILAAGNKAAALTQQLLAFSRKQVLQPRVMDLNEVVAGMGAIIRRIIGEDITLVLNLARDPCPIQADPAQMEQVIMNLAVNARDAMPRGGRLSLTTRSQPPEQSGAMVTLQVSDTGIGMDQATLARAFEPFFTTKGAGKGTGLGLSIVYGVVQQSGGVIEVQSEPGRGAVFTMRFPRTLAAENTAEESSPARASRGGTVLLVEDEDAVRALCAEMLQQLGCQVLAAANADEARQVWARHGAKVDLLLTDVFMPGLSGPELAQLLRTERPSLRVLLMSGNPAGRMNEEQSARFEAAFISKPFTLEQIGLHVNAILAEDWAP